MSISVLLFRTFGEISSGTLGTFENIEGTIRDFGSENLLMLKIAPQKILHLVVIAL